MKNSALALIAMLAAGAVQAESATTLRATELQAQAQADAATLAKLPEKTRVDILRRVGAWNEVKTASGQSGWVSMFNLKLDGSGKAGTPANTENSSNALKGLLSSGRTSSTGTEIAGVKGLKEADINNAQANPAEFQKMQKNAVDKSTGQGYGQRNKLSPAKVDYLSAPMAPARRDEPSAGVGMGGN